MSLHNVAYLDTNQFKSIINNFLSLSASIKAFFPHEHQIPYYQKLIDSKTSFYNQSQRKVLHQAITNQYQNFTLSKTSQQNINLLLLDNTLTITTGHQLNLMTGPLYFFYKIISTIKLSQQLKRHYPNNHFVPVFWMATEDHDFDEVNHFYDNDQKVQWHTKCKGAVGKLSTKDITTLVSDLNSLLGNSMYANDLINLFTNAYNGQNTWADATRTLVHHIFDDYGILILDGDNKALKKLMIPYLKQEVLDQTTFYKVSETNNILKKNNYHIQVIPREINLFYLNDERQRIIKKEHLFCTVDDSKQWDLEDLLSEIEQYTERFSPNVLMRPLYQEIVLPNIAYVGGAGELAYWLQLQKSFEAFNVPFPQLVLRDSVTILTNKQWQKAQKLHIEPIDIYSDLTELINKKVKVYQINTIDFNELKKQLKHQFELLKTHAEQTDKSFKNALDAQEKKQLNGLDKLEKRWLKAAKKVHQDQLNRISLLYNQIHPQQHLQERHQNFMVFYKDYGAEFIKLLFTHLNPLDNNFKIIVLND